MVVTLIGPFNYFRKIKHKHQKKGRKKKRSTNFFRFPFSYASENFSKLSFLKSAVLLKQIMGKSPLLLVIVRLRNTDSVQSEVATGEYSLEEGRNSSKSYSMLGAPS
jgi:hypothetical protein